MNVGKSKVQNKSMNVIKHKGTQKPSTTRSLDLDFKLKSTLNHAINLGKERLH